MLIIGVIKYPIDASWTLLMLTANINPVQFIVINEAVIDKIIIFFLELKILRKSFILVKNNKIIKRKMKDHKPLWKATSKGGTYFISLKINGWGIPQKTEARQI